MSRSGAGVGAETQAVLGELLALLNERRVYRWDAEDDHRRLGEWGMLAANAVIAGLVPPFTRQGCRAQWLRAASILVAAVEALDRRGEV